MSYEDEESSPLKHAEVEGGERPQLTSPAPLTLAIATIILQLVYV